MTDWTAGYVAEIDYTHGYYTELNPTRLKLAFAANGWVPPEVAVACELGFGQGLGPNIHAAASTVSWWGTDFNPSQAAFAQELGAVTGAKLFDESFADFCTRPDLPDFDYIALHGIWSWISDENRGVIADFVRRKLKVGGVLYISYNTLPGWSTAAPLQHLMSQYTQTMGALGDGILNRVGDAIGFTEKLLAMNPVWGRANPQIGERFKTINSQNRHYLAHEYFNQHWHPAYFADMASCLEAVKLSFAGSAHYLDYQDSINLTAEQQTFLKDVADNNFRQTVRDYMVNQQFRKDYWVKGARRLNAFDRGDFVRAQSVVLTLPRDAVSFKIRGALGEANMAETVCNPILDLLADYQPKTLAQLEAALKLQKITLPMIENAITLLVGAGYLSPAQNTEKINACKLKSLALNQLLINKARGSGDVGFLASPVTGGGVSVNRFQQLFLLAQQQGHTAPEAWAAFAWDILASQDQRLIKDGKTLDTPDDNLNELTSQAHRFLERNMPIISALQVI